MYCLISAAVCFIGTGVQKALKRHHIFIFYWGHLLNCYQQMVSISDSRVSFHNIPQPRRFVASLSHEFQPQTVEFRANPTEFLANPSRIPRGTVTDEVARWIWPICWHQLFGFSIVVAFLKYVTISTTTCLTGSHTQTRRGAIFKPFL